MVRAPLDALVDEWVAAEKLSYHRSVSAFRDEYAALLDRLARLEEDLATARPRGGNPSALARELDELMARVAEATARADADRRALADVSAAIERMRKTVAPASMAPPETPAAAVPPRSRATWLVGISVVVCAAFAYWAVVSSLAPAPDRAPPRMPDTLNPSTLIEQARRNALDAGLPSNGQLTGLHVRYASSDGSIHIQDPRYRASVEFQFATPPPPLVVPDPSAPLGAPGRDPQQRGPGSIVTVTFDGEGVHSFKNELMPAVDPSLPNPHCSTADVWKAAMAAGAPSDAVAALTYEEAYSGIQLEQVPRWHFAIASTHFDYSVSDVDCKVVR